MQKFLNQILERLKSADIASADILVLKARFLNIVNNMQDPESKAQMVIEFAQAIVQKQPLEAMQLIQENILKSEKVSIKAYLVLRQAFAVANMPKELKDTEEKIKYLLAHAQTTPEQKKENVVLWYPGEENPRGARYSVNSAQQSESENPQNADENSLFLQTQKVFQQLHRLSSDKYFSSRLNEVAKQRYTLARESHLQEQNHGQDVLFLQKLCRQITANVHEKSMAQKLRFHELFISSYWFFYPCEELLFYLKYFKLFELDAQFLVIYVKTLSHLDYHQHVVEVIKRVLTHNIPIDKSQLHVEEMVSALKASYENLGFSFPKKTIKTLQDLVALFASRPKLSLAAVAI